MAIFEGFVFAGTDWNDRTNFIMQDFDPGVAPKRWQWISGADSDGALPVEEAHYDNAEMTVRLRIAPQANMDAALAKIGTLVLALQEAEKQALGTTAVWTPAGSTKSLTAYIVGGEVTGIPLSLTGDDAGWFLRSPAPVVTMKLYRRPFLYGAEVTNAATVTNTDPVQLLTLASVTGDVPAEARLVITDGASQNRRHVEWGLQQRYYDAATSLLIDSDSMVVSGFSGAQTTRTGAYDNPVAGNNVIRGSLTSNPVAVCGLGNLGHVGTFRVKARVFSANASDPTAVTSAQVRLSWREGDGPLRSNAYATAVGRNWAEIDLGLISIPEKQLGTQRWTGQIEAYSTLAADVVDIDYIVLIPAGEGYGKGRWYPVVSTVLSYSAHDEFDQTAGNLNTKVLAAGGSWATSGADATDITVEATGHTAQRATTGDASGKWAIAGTTTFTDSLVQIDAKRSATASPVVRLILRWTDVNNHLYVEMNPSANPRGYTIKKVVTGTTTTIANGTLTDIPVAAYYTFRALVTAAGQINFSYWVTGADPPANWMVTASDTDLVTGGTLASGKVGFYDSNVSATASTRNYDNFIAAGPAQDAVVYSGRTAEIRSDSAQRQDSSGTYYGPIASYRGARLYIPPAGSAARTTRILVKARRNDIDVAPDDQIADSTTATLNYTPRFLVAPR